MRLQLVCRGWQAVSRSLLPATNWAVLESTPRNPVLTLLCQTPLQPGSTSSSAHGPTRQLKRSVFLNLGVVTKPRAVVLTDGEFGMRVRQLLPVDTIYIRSCPSSTLVLLNTLRRSFLECRTMSLSQTSTPPAATRLQNASLQFLLSQHLPLLHTFEYSGGYPIDAAHLALLPSLRTPGLRSVTVLNLHRLCLSNLTDLSLEALPLSSGPLECISAHSRQLTRLRYSSEHIKTTLLANTLLANTMEHLVTLEMPDTTVESAHLMRAINSMPSLTRLYASSCTRATELSPRLSHLRVKTSNGDLQLASLTHFETLGSNSPLNLPSSLTSASLPAQDLLSLRGCSRLRHLSWFMDSSNDFEFLQELLPCLDEMWPDLTRMCITPSCDEWNGGWPFNSSWHIILGHDHPAARVLQRFASRAVPRALEHLTFMQHTQRYANAGVFTAIRQLTSLRSLVLVRMDVPLFQLRRLAAMPALELIDLVNVTGVTSENYASVQREAAVDHGVCALRVTFRSTNFGFVRDSFRGMACGV